MNRRQFSMLLGLGASAAAFPQWGNAMNTQLFEQLKQFPDTAKMPVLFLGHGSPMFAIEPNQFTQNFQRIVKKIPQPTAILCISAHWESQGSWLTAMPKPRTIHDFYGFPKALYDVQYPADGSPELAGITQQILQQRGVDAHLDDSEWGLDHGTWSVLKYLYPEADVPVVQLSIDHYKSPQQHYDLAKQLAVLRRKGVLIVGSGNAVHNLRMLARGKSETEIFGYDWALEADEKIRQAVISGNHRFLTSIENQGEAFKLAIPTAEHYLPLLYALAVQERGDSVEIFNEYPVEGSITMTSVAIGV